MKNKYYSLLLHIFFLMLIPGFKIILPNPQPSDNKEFSTGTPGNFYNLLNNDKTIPGSQNIYYRGLPYRPNNYSRAIRR